MVEGKVAIITGAARGLGYGIAELLGQRGAKVVITDLDSEGLKAAEDTLRGAGIQVASCIGNVAEVPAIEAMIDAAAKAFGGIDILVNNAGGSAHTPLFFDRVMDWNVRGTFFCIKLALPYLKKQGGSIINISSIAGRAGTALVSPQYAAAKAGIVGLTRNLAHHLGPHGIRVNAIAPGFMKSGPRVDAIWKTRNESEVLSRVPLGRRGEIEDISEAALFLASDASKYMTGTVLDVNGGFMTA